MAEVKMKEVTIAKAGKVADGKGGYLDKGAKVSVPESSVASLKAKDLI